MVVLLQAVSVSLLAQSKPQAGDVISGVVSESYGPMMMVNVVERDSANRIVAHSLTDMEGNFSFRLVNPDHKIEVSYVGYETVSVPIDTTYFEIKMKEQDDMPQVGNTPEKPTKKIMGLMDQDSWTFEYMPRIPKMKM